MRGLILTAKSAKAAEPHANPYISSLPSSRSLMNDSEWVVNHLLSPIRFALSRLGGRQRRGFFEYEDEYEDEDDCLVSKICVSFILLRIAQTGGID
jgi:hypothetical protein